MKKIFTLVLGLALMTACSSDDSGNSVDVSKLTNKKWYFASYKVAGQTIPYENDDATCGRDYNQFLVNGTLEDAYFSDCALFVDEGTWVLNGNKLTGTFEGDIETVTIKKLTGTELEVEAKNDFDENGTEETVRVVFTSN